jgi:hypothetical protein
MRRYFVEPRDTCVIAEAGVCATYLVTEIEERPDMYRGDGPRYQITASKVGRIGQYVLLNLATREEANTFQIGDALDLVRRPRS